MRSFRVNRIVIANWLSAMLIFLFVYTATSKFTEPDVFKATLERSPLIGKQAAFLSWVVPTVEIIISLLLLLPSYRRMGFIASGVLLILFSLYILYMLLYVPHLPCSCGGVIRELSWSQHLWFNGSFILFSLLGWRAQRNQHKDFIAINRQSRIPV